jgi:hypothetical protein
MARSRRNDPLLAQIQESLLDRVDRRLALILGASLAVHVGIAAYAWSADLEQPATLPAPPVATRYMDVIDVVIPDLAARPPAAVPGIATPPTAPSAHRIVHPTTLTASNPNPGVVDPQQLAGMLTGNDDETPRPHTDLGAQIIDVRDGHYTIGDGTHTSRTDDRANLGTRDETPIADDPTLTHTPDTHRAEPHGRIIPGTVTPDSTTSLTPALVLERIQSQYMAGLQRCYRLGLAADSQLSGKVAIKLTVDERGQVADPEAAGVSSQVDSCISDQMSRWRFPIPKDKDGAATEASFAVSLALQPS